MSQLNILVLHASEDKEILNKLLLYLKSLKKEHKLNIWHDNPVHSGQEWKSKNEKRFRETDVFLLLASNDFMYSPFIQQLDFKKVIDQHRQGKSKVIPIILDKCPWDTDFSSEDYNFNMNELQVLPTDGKPIKDWQSSEEAYKTIAAGIKKTILDLKGIDIP
jgi:hypothetical protein